MGRPVWNVNTHGPKWARKTTASVKLTNDRGDTATGTVTDRDPHKACRDALRVAKTALRELGN